jgi:hypothetical protein
LPSLIGKPEMLRPSQKILGCGRRVSARQEEIPAADGYQYARNSADSDRPNQAPSSTGAGYRLVTQSQA